MEREVYLRPGREMAASLPMVAIVVGGNPHRDFFCGSFRENAMEVGI